MSRHPITREPQPQPPLMTQFKQAISTNWIRPVSIGVGTGLAVWAMKQWMLVPLFSKVVSENYLDHSLIEYSRLNGTVAQALLPPNTTASQFVLDQLIKEQIQYEKEKDFKNFQAKGRTQDSSSSCASLACQQEWLQQWDFEHRDLYNTVAKELRSKFIDTIKAETLLDSLFESFSRSIDPTLIYDLLIHRIALRTTLNGLSNLAHRPIIKSPLKQKIFVALSMGIIYALPFSNTYTNFQILPPEQKSWILQNRAANFVLGVCLALLNEHSKGGIKSTFTTRITVAVLDVLPRI